MVNGAVANGVFWIIFALLVASYVIIYKFWRL